MELVICLSTGPWQAVIMAASLKKNFSKKFLQENRIILLNIVKENQKQTIKANDLIFKSFNLWTESYNFEISGKGFKSEFSERRINDFKVFLEVKNITNANKLILKSTNFLEDRLMSCLQKKADLIIVEDGAHSWFQTESMFFSKTDYNSFYFQTREFFKGLLFDYLVQSPRFLSFPHSTRIKEKFSTFPEKYTIETPGPSYQELTGQDFKNVLKSINSRTKSKLIPNKEIVFLGSNFLEGGYLWPDEEYELYIRYVKKVISMGFYVRYKPHPRANRIYSDYLKLKVDSEKFSLSTHDTALPIESLYDWSKENIVVGTVSSSLWYLRKIFKVKCFTILDEYHQSIIQNRCPVMGKIALGTINEIPHVDTFIKSSKPSKV